MVIRRQHALLTLVIAAGFGVMASAQTAKPAAKAPAKTAAKSAKKRARVFFVEPKNGATVTSPVKMKFGAEGIEIVAVPPGDVTTSRPGVGHYHLGIDQSCLAPNKMIVKGTPSWVHFGDGKSEIEVQLTPGKHKLALQIGDDLHKTLPGTCTSITLNIK